MSLYDKSSLIQVPSLYKDGTLVSTIPEDRSGDFTFSRGSNLSATRVGEDGYIKKGYENLLFQSNSFTTSPWSVSSGVSIVGNQSGYDGSNDAWLLNKNLSQAFLYQGVTFSGVQTISIYAKAGSLNWVLVGSAIYGGYFDLFNGVEGSSIGSAISTKITPVGDGWYRCEVSGIYNITTSFRVYPADGDLDTSGTSGSIYIQDAQLNQGLAAYPYLETTTAPVQGGLLENTPRLDWSNGVPALLLELQRTNLIRHSEYFLGENNWFGGLGLTFGYDSSILNPENYYGCTTAIGNHLKRYSVINGVSVGTKLSYSIFAKSNSNANFTFGGIAGEESATFNINAGTLISQGSSVDSYDIVDYSNGWRKYVVNTTFQDAIGNGQVYVNISWNDAIEPAYLYGLQLEQDATYPTSYIPTYGTSQTRLGDSVSALDISSILGTNSYTIFLDVETENIGSNSNAAGDIFYLSVGSQTLAIDTRVSVIQDDSSSTTRIKVDVGDDIKHYKGALQVTPTTATIFGNGIKGDSGTSRALSPTSFSFYYNNKLNYNKLLLFPTALSDDECIALTTIS